MSEAFFQQLTWKSFTQLLWPKIGQAPVLGCNLIYDVNTSQYSPRIHGLLMKQYLDVKGVQIMKSLRIQAELPIV